ncbi:CVNH domain-containing protein [Magnetospirillum sp. 15-1]|uniref:CVNH domain-containing protein n=1 Tax=Magnetospirillum sp. 15-1 TaxID=1979370 RepID=UPI000BBBBEBF|nr:CVNH domain-containing protein [Magnetospirillum sp. 15-1]
MKKILIAAAALVLAAAAPVLANPAGSYTKTCSGASMNGDTLSATCTRMDGSQAQTSLQFASSCVGDIGNINGVLACAGPNGSYSMTCSNISVSGNTLNASCRTKAGQMVPASLPGFQGFQGNISNCDGKLQNGPC